MKSNSLSILICLANDRTKHKDLKLMVIVDINLSDNRNIALFLKYVMCLCSGQIKRQQAKRLTFLKEIDY